MGRVCQAFEGTDRERARGVWQWSLMDYVFGSFYEFAQEEVDLIFLFVGGRLLRLARL